MAASNGPYPMAASPISSVSSAASNGTRTPPTRHSPWGYGYGGTPGSLEEFYDRFERLCGALLGNPGMFGYCYTQLTDVFQEQNGIYRFDRSPKFDLTRIRAAQSRIAEPSG